MLGCRAMFPPSIFEDRCVHFRRSMCRVLKIDVSTFEDRCVDLPRSMIDVLTFGDRCVDLRGSKIDVKLCCYTSDAQKIDTIVVCELR